MAASALVESSSTYLVYSKTNAFGSISKTSFLDSQPSPSFLSSISTESVSYLDSAPRTSFLSGSNSKSSCFLDSAPRTSFLSDPNVRSSALLDDAPSTSIIDDFSASEKSESLAITNGPSLLDSYEHSTLMLGGGNSDWTPEQRKEFNKLKNEKQEAARKQKAEQFKASQKAREEKRRKQAAGGKKKKKGAGRGKKKNEGAGVDAASLHVNIVEEKGAGDSAWGLADSDGDSDGEAARRRRDREYEQEHKSSALTVDVDSFMYALESKMDEVRAADFSAFDEVEEKRQVAAESRRQANERKAQQDAAAAQERHLYAAMQAEQQERQLRQQQRDALTAQLISMGFDNALVQEATRKYNDLVPCIDYISKKQESAAKYDARLPRGWEMRKMNDGRTFFANHVLKRTQWDDPRPFPHGWKQHKDPKSGRTYYRSTELRKTQWDDPRGPVAPGNRPN